MYCRRDDAVSHALQGVTHPTYSSHSTPPHVTSHMSCESAGDLSISLGKAEGRVTRVLIFIQTLNQGFLHIRRTAPPLIFIRRSFILIHVPLPLLFVQPVTKINAFIKAITVQMLSGKRCLPERGDPIRSDKGRQLHSAAGSELKRSEVLEAGFRLLCPTSSSPTKEEDTA